MKAALEACRDHTQPTYATHRAPTETSVADVVDLVTDGAGSFPKCKAISDGGGQHKTVFWHGTGVFAIRCGVCHLSALANMPLASCATICSSLLTTRGASAPPICHDPAPTRRMVS